MRTIACLAASSIILASTAQPVITLNNIPQLGDISSIGICSDNVDATALAASAGAMQTWDFSGISEISEEQFTFVAPGVTPWPTTFTGSDLCGVSWDDAYSYYAVNGGYLESIGQALIVPGTPPEDTMKLLYTQDTERIVPLPYTFGDVFNDSFAGTFAVGGFSGTVDGTVEFEADGYGALILPNGSYENVVRYHINRVQNNTIGGFPPNVTSKEQWAWVSSDHRFWLLLMELNDDGIGGEESIVWYDKAPLPAGPTSVNGVDVTAIGIYPNPAAVGTTISLDLPGTSGIARIELRDATGRLVRNERTTTLSTADLRPGAFFIRAIGTDGASWGIQRLILH